MNIITAVYNFLWGDLITLPLPGGSSIGISLLVLLLVPAGIYFTIRTRFVLIRKFPHMIQIAMEKNEHSQAGSISGFQALIVATATRVGMGNLVGVVAAISAGGAGADIYQQKGDKKTKLGETASESGVYPFRDRLFETEWGDGRVNIRYFGGGEIWRECRFELS